VAPANLSAPGAERPDKGSTAPTTTTDRHPLEYRATAVKSTGGVAAMMTGVVKWFNNAKGYGFVKPDNRDEDVFVHFSSIEMEGYKTLKEGQKVEFEVNHGPKGLHAARVQRAY
jgi:CspA family cold shock protein